MCAKINSKTEYNLNFSESYYSDLREKGMYFAAVVRSPVSKGIYKGIDDSDLPEGFYYFDWKDLNEQKEISILDTKIPLFCTGEIQYTGQSLGIITGPDFPETQRLAREIKILIQDEDYNQKEEESNLLSSRRIDIGIDFDEVEAEHTIEGVWESGIYPSSYQETNGAFVKFNGKQLEIFCPSHWTTNLQQAVKKLFDLKDESIQITRTRFNSKNTNDIILNTILTCQTCLASIRLKKSVKLLLTKEEQETIAENIASVKIFNRAKVNSEGKILSLDINIHVNAGAMNPLCRELADRLAVSSTGIYNIQNIHINSNIYKSRSYPATIDFSTLDSKAFYSIENLMNKIAGEINKSPIETRLVNINFDPKISSIPFEHDLGKVREAIDAISAKSIFERKNAVYKNFQKDTFISERNSPFSPPLRGIGFVCGYEGNLFLGSQFNKNISIELTFTKEKKLLIKSIPTSKNILAIWKDICSKILEIPQEDIELNLAFNSSDIPDIPEELNSNISVQIQLLTKACEALKKKITDGKTVSIKKAFVQNSKKGFDTETFTGHPYNSSAFGAMVIEIELDPATYREQIRGIYIILDAGKIMNVKAAEISIKNSVQELLSQLYEDDEINFTNLSIQFIQSNEEPKQIGNIVASLLPAAFTTALSQTISYTVNRLPLKTDSIFKISRKARKVYMEKMKALAEQNDQNQNPGDAE